MTDVNEQIDKLTDLQRKALEPTRAFTGYAVDTFEVFMRQNFALMGDLVDCARAQVRLLGQSESINDYVTQQFEQGRNLAEKMTQHVQQYVALGSNAAREAANVTRAEISKAANTPPAA